jgi:hypothetical protein
MAPSKSATTGLASVQDRLFAEGHATAVGRDLEWATLESADLCNGSGRWFAELFEISRCLNLITPAMPKPISNTATIRHITNIMKDRKLNFFIWLPSAVFDGAYFPLVSARRFL